MRSLPPPRETNKRLWLRLKRSVKTLFKTGSISDPGAFRLRKRVKTTPVTKSRIRNYRTKNFLDNLGIRSTASNSYKTVKFAGKIVHSS